MYYLRSNKQKQDYCPEQSESQFSSEEKKPRRSIKVALNRFSLLENLDNHKEIFNVEGSKLYIRRKDAHKTWILVLSVFFLVLGTLYYEDQYGPYEFQIVKIVEKLPRKLAGINENMKNYLHTTWTRNFGQVKPRVPLESIDEQKPKSQKRRSDVCYYDIRDFIEVYLSELKREDPWGRKPLSFIEEECERVRVVEKIADNCKNPQNESENVDIESIPNYASYSEGARVLSTSTTKPYADYKVETGVLRYILGVKPFTIDVVPICQFSTMLCNYFVAGSTSVLQPWKNPGECWSFKGSRGRIHIELSERIYITAVTLEHIPANMASAEDVRSAPKTFSLIGIDDSEGRKFTARYHLGTYKYLLGKPHIQTFSLEPEDALLPFKIVELNVESNHGNEEYTCVYRFRVHGHL